MPRAAGKAAAVHRCSIERRRGTSGTAAALWYASELSLPVCSQHQLDVLVHHKHAHDSYECSLEGFINRESLGLQKSRWVEHFCTCSSSSRGWPAAQAVLQHQAGARRDPAPVRPTAAAAATTTLHSAATAEPDSAAAAQLGSRAAATAGARAAAPLRAGGRKRHPAAAAASGGGAQRQRIAAQAGQPNVTRAVGAGSAGRRAGHQRHRGPAQWQGGPARTAAAADALVLQAASAPE